MAKMISGLINRLDKREVGENVDGGGNRAEKTRRGLGLFAIGFAFVRRLSGFRFLV
jgi:hypothetical protein